MPARSSATAADARLRRLESEAIHILREVAAQCGRTAILFSGGKDSITVAWLARKAFAPARLPFALLHIDTGHNFAETLAFRDRFARDMACELVVRTVEDSIAQGRVADETGPGASRNTLQSVTLLDAIKELKLDAAIGGARRDEEKARAKERVFSHRDFFGAWDPKNQRPELWSLYNGRKHPGEHFRVFPLSNWTELDIWSYIAEQHMPLPELYFAHERDVIRRDGMLMANSPFVGSLPGDEAARLRVRFRTVGDITCTGAIESAATTVDEIVTEVAASRITERGGRGDDRRSETAMEDRKRQGYF